MEAKELMIGDWVQYDRSYPPMGIKKPIQVTLQGLIDISQCDDDIEPIPLTPEILEKNGFHWDGSGTRTQMKMTDYFEEGQRWFVYVHHEAKSFDLFTSFPIDHPRIRNWRRHNRCDMEVCGFYVHELQHALRLCGLNELADNFKV